MNTSRRATSEPNLFFSNKEELLKNVKDQNITDARRITMSWNGQMLPMKQIILTFNSPTLLTIIKTALLSCPVRAYTPNSLCWFNWQCCDHTTIISWGSITCAPCQQVGHDGKPEKFLNSAINCKGIMHHTPVIQTRSLKMKLLLLK